MLKNFKLSKRNSDSKGRITSLDISTPTNVSDSSMDASFHMKNGSGLYGTESAKSSSRLSSSSKRLSSKSKHSSPIKGPSIVASGPDRVIKALHHYNAKSSKELSFGRGDFFYVTSDRGDWYDVTNPAAGKSGLVPKSLFEVIDKRSSSTSSMGNTSLTGSQTGNKKFGSLYAIVLYDFKAEKSDELSVHVGENLFICAHHNYEWFIAKPIGRLGGPGLVPVGFVSIIDIATGYASGNDIGDDIASVNLPTVQEWKSNVAKYKASNITLGQFESDYNQDLAMFDDGNNTISQMNGGLSAFASEADDLNTDYLTNAAVLSFSFEDEKYWYEVNCELSNGRLRKLKRSYQDFYDLQVQLLDKFPAESGKLRDKNGQWTKRIVPYIPGPVPYVTDSITQKRMDDLDVYVKELIKLPEYISNSPLVNHLFNVSDNGFDGEYSSEVPSQSELQDIDENRSEDNFNSEGPRRVLSSRKNSRASSTNRRIKNEDSTLTGEDMKMFDRLSKLSLNSSKPKSRPPSALPPAIKPTKIKFYYKDDIFALLLSHDINFIELREKIAPRVESDDFKLYVKLTEGDAEEIRTDAQVLQIIQAKLKISVHDS
ncbi:similar to Saccharomyces cerevisiae YBR200W BEM1 Protein containing SH3-domains, involved in establishing cell polarity and morphogenesis [Maudiozyma barnettii]|uniref:Similar to Saccharomyces cerevisiae YBR200W BEM1 Protein containing SH3-domains, involved in establishing cell polarity and morphogenesis n=1 Tax=Maudiozyma barnettii TaxID=61262 RepID=A0A8H2ZGI6_9SACH|nr:phosphatidylinositol-3-phosphate-binding protein BEM1 [Kazachstania barnettii]CAB4253688.1 similar to Saccharomyces cerevisiae YBR200W BEM1 Protein containing SH3-domains, involved in establishing cell polarity and morphogenesis [Kazachstania barnettii]CAD1781408.1 similar to Saccharomyces cerevisiae YBR200W BEM1 Protein containing SH3-domains, involved in establishing cell polarity and morphogenesis [Kazachstania barnettii]